MFDADQYCAAHHEPPAFTWKGRRFVGRILSAEEWVMLHAQREDVTRRNVGRAEKEIDRDQRRGDLREETTERVVRRALRVGERFTRRCIVSWFPVPWYRRPLASLWPALFHPPWRAFRQMPPKVQVEAVKDFSESQRNAMPESQPPGTTAANNPTPPGPRSDT